MKVWIIKALTSTGLGIATFAAIMVLPDTQSMGDLKDFILTPGYFLAALIWPDGIHSNDGIYWVVIAVLFDVIIYSLCWFGILHFVKAVRESKHRNIKGSKS